MRAGKIPAVLAAAVIAAFASSAGAQEFSLSPSPTITGGNVIFHGSFVNLYQTTSINCAVTATLNVVGGPGSLFANISSPSISPGNSFCGLLVYPIPFWSAQAFTTLPSPGASTTIFVTVGANTIANDPCDPQTVQALLTTPISGPSTLTFNNVMLQARSGRFDRVCRINGVLTATGISSNRVFIH